VIFAYFNDADYLRASSHLNLDKLFLKFDAVASVN
jgi:hypothetical protein